ncbi:MAG: hypothetical protein JWN62_1072 [Acidimicrobiales bacterium]|nr:hypothetical protein [Acidimicrobiales bacterium]
MPYIDVSGLPTWFEAGSGGGPTVLLLHGGLSNGDALLESIGVPLAAQYRVAAFDRRGHGRTADTPEPFHYEAMADETIAVLAHLDTPVHLVGWSDGGITALLVALRRPDLVDRLVLIGVNFHFSGTLDMSAQDDADQAGGHDDPFLAQMQASYAERSPDGAAHFADVATKSFALFATEPTLTTDDLRAVSAPTLVMVGDDDLVDLGHTCQLYESIPAAQLAVVPGASHALPMERPDETSRIIAQFLAGPVPPQTLIPVRRG